MTPYRFTSSPAGEEIASGSPKTSTLYSRLSKITFAVDGNNTVKTFNYFGDIVRDNAYGDVWEYVNTGDGNQYENLFWTIVDSTTTIVRFEGDNYWYDLTVSQNDKDAIRSVLTAFDALRDAGCKVI